MMRSTGRPPIALFAYRRPEHLQLTLAALRENRGASDTDLVVFSDGPRSPADAGAVGKVRSLLRDAGGFRSIRVVERPENLGLSRSVLQGVDQMLAQSDSVIVLEDDMVTSPQFLDFMNAGLALYQDAERVVCVHGYQMRLPGTAPETYFIRGADCWGWGTWRRAWHGFRRNGSALLAEIERRNLQNDFDYWGSYPYTSMLRDAIAGRVDSWAILWYASAFLQEQLTLYPGRSLVCNIGNDGSGQHRGNTDAYATELSEAELNVEAITPEADEHVRRLMAAALARGRAGGWRRFARLLGRVTRGG